MSFVALVAALMAMVIAAPVGANPYTRGNDFELSIVNDSTTNVSAAACLNGHVSLHYQFGTTADPCDVTPLVQPHLWAGGTRWNNLTANPIGIIVRAPHHKTLYFYAYNPSIGKPFVEVNGHRYALVEGELKEVPVDGAIVAFHRHGDRDGHKVFLIQIKRMAAG
ncbi:MAG: hypothetical protein JST59_27655 [Actinobacteria bacterium]|nr:hypothetical protein [Actinomycetota bacterium]